MVGRVFGSTALGCSVSWLTGPYDCPEGVDGTASVGVAGYEVFHAALIVLAPLSAVAFVAVIVRRARRV